MFYLLIVHHQFCLVHNSCEWFFLTNHVRLRILWLICIPYSIGIKCRLSMAKIYFLADIGKKMGILGMIFVVYAAR